MLKPYTFGSIGAAKNDNSGLAGLEIYLGASKGRRSRHRTLYVTRMLKYLLLEACIYSKVQVHSWTYIRGSRSMSLYVLYACMRTQLASPAEWHLQLSME